MDAQQLRLSLQKGGPDDQKLGNDFWSSTIRFTEMLTKASSQARSNFLPLVKSLDTTIVEELLPSPNHELAAQVQAAMDEQVAIQSTPGAFPGSKGQVTVQIHASKNGVPVNGLYVWLDLACCVRKNGAAYALPNVTSPAKGAVMPGTYQVRLRQSDKTVAERRVLIGAASGVDKVDVILP